MNVTSFEDVHLNISSLNLPLKFCDNLDVYVIGLPFPIGAENVNDLSIFTSSEIVHLIVTVILFVFAFTGNLLVIAVVCYNPTLRSTINYYLLNLAVADLLISVVCMWDNVLRSLSYNYLLGAVGCKAVGLIHVSCLLASVFTLAGIAIDRCYAVIFPFQARLTPSHPGRIIAAIWITSCAIASPYFALLKYETYRWTDFTELQCNYNLGKGIFDDATLTCSRDESFIKLYHMMMAVALYFLPAFFIILAYIFIVLKLWIFKELTDSDMFYRISAKKQVVRLAIVVLTAFLVCWTPLQVLIISSVTWASQSQVADPHRDHFWIYLLAYSNSALNPLIYGGLNNSYRTGLRNLIKRDPKNPCLPSYSSRRITTKTYSASSHVSASSSIKVDPRSLQMTNPRMLGRVFMPHVVSSSVKTNGHC